MSPDARHVEFHDVAADGGDTWTLLGRLARAGVEAGETVLVLAADVAQADDIDQALWSIGDDVFLPHARANDDHAELATILIAAPGETAAPRRWIINQRDAAVDLSCARILELIPADETGRQAARRRWRAYQARGLMPVKAS